MAKVKMVPNTWVEPDYEKLPSWADSDGGLRVNKQTGWGNPKAKFEIDGRTLAIMHALLVSHNFKLCAPPPHDGRHDVWLGACRLRDIELAETRRALKKFVPQKYGTGFDHLPF
jgi:hypothetical protein